MFVKGARPGDVLAVEILELRPRDWGWTAIIPGFGLLADDFPDPWLRISEVDAAARRVRFGDPVPLPFEPFPGTIGVAPPEPGEHSVVPPRWGGNLDIKHLRAGTTLLLPVGVDGALFSVGDTHAAMGDGEVCGTASRPRWTSPCASNAAPRHGERRAAAHVAGGCAPAPRPAGITSPRACATT